MTGKEAAEICNRFGIIARKRWGQNFLCSEEVSDRIIDIAGIKNEDFVLEIGPGIGALTGKICAHARSVLAVEIDPVLVRYLKENFDYSKNCTVICEDFLKLSKERIVLIGKPRVVVSNLPYNLTTPIISRLMSDFSDAETMVFMVEEDACDRIFAKPSEKAYGPISVISSAFGRKEKLFSIPPQCFFPSPHTRSMVIRFSRQKSDQPIPGDFVHFVYEAMKSRRKTLMNVINHSSEYFAARQKVKDFLITGDHPENIRAEALTSDEFLALYRLLNTFS